MNRWLTLVALLVCLTACDQKSPSTPTLPPTPTGPNQAPQVVATYSPDIGIDELTTYTVRIQVTDPDNDPVVLQYRRCDIVPNDTTIPLINGVATLSLKADPRCGVLLTLTGVDARGASTLVYASADHMGLTGTYRLVIGDGHYAVPFFYVNLKQAGAVVTGTIWEYPHSDHTGGIDAAEPGHLEDDGQFRLRFKIASEPDLIVSGRLVAPAGGPLTSNVIASGQVVGGRYTGKGFQIWHEESY